MNKEFANDEERQLYGRRALGTMLAALRMWQLAMERGDVPEAFLDIATDGGDLEPLTAAEIDEACEVLNERDDDYDVSDDGEAGV